MALERLGRRQPGPDRVPLRGRPLSRTPRPARKAREKLNPSNERRVDAEEGQHGQRQQRHPHREPGQATPRSATPSAGSPSPTSPSPPTRPGRTRAARSRSDGVAPRGGLRQGRPGRARLLLSKGRQVYIEGSIRYDEWTDKDGNKRNTTKIHVGGPNSRLVLLGSRGEGGGGGGGGPRAGAEAARASRRPAGRRLPGLRRRRAVLDSLRLPGTTPSSGGRRVAARI